MLDNMELKAELIMAMRDFECEEKQRWDKWIDVTALEARSDGKILLRIITEPKTKSGTVGVDMVRKMAETMEKEHYDKGVLISKRFSAAARREMIHEGIQMMSEKFMPRFKLQKLYLKIQDRVDDLCKIKCRFIPKKESDCKGYSNGHYSCMIRLISDNSSFHFERGWLDLLQKDLMRLLAVRNNLNDQQIV